MLKMTLTLPHAPRGAHGFCWSQSSVRRIASAIVSVGRQPSARMREQSRWISGLSPGQPRHPPVYSISGATPRCSVIVAIESSTTTVSSVPRL